MSGLLCYCSRRRNIDRKGKKAIEGKEKNNWEIENEFGVVLEKHYKTKDACVKAGQKLADECHCELCVCDTTSCSNE